MPRYFTHFYNSDVLRDERGQEFETLAEARRAALTGAGELIADHINQGKIVDLDDRLEIVDENGRVVSVLRFADFFKGSGGISSSSSR